MRPWDSHRILESRRGAYTAGLSPTSDERFPGGKIYCADWWGVRLQFLGRVDEQRVVLQWNDVGAFNQEVSIDAPVGHPVDIVVPHRGRELTVLLLSGPGPVTYDYLLLTHTNRRERPGDLAPDEPLLASFSGTVGAGVTTDVSIPWFSGPVHAFASATTPPAATPTADIELLTRDFAGALVKFETLYLNDSLGNYNTPRVVELPPAINVVRMVNGTANGALFVWALTPIRGGR